MTRSLSHAALNQIEMVCLDCETTGLDTENDRIIEVAIAVFKGGEIIESFETLVDPKRDIPEESRKIHGISEAMVAGKPLIETLLPAIFKMIDHRPIMGHGIGFDLAVLKSECKRAHLLWPFEEIVSLDTLRLARLYGGSPVNSLERLRQHFNIADEVAHRAMSDVWVNIQVFQKLTMNFKSLKEVTQTLLQPIEMKTMPLGKHKGRLLKEIPLEYLQWAVRKDFDVDLMFSLRQEIKRRQKGLSFNQASNPFANL